ncbi:MAG: hypothetical protein U0838_05025 [Chloroflexota bacterium]
MYRLRRLSPILAALVALALAASPVSAASPFTPATGHWVSIDGAAANTFGEDFMWNTRMGPDGKLYAFGDFHNASGNATADMLVWFDTSTQTWKGVGSNGAGDGAFNDAVYSAMWIGTDLYVSGRFTNAGGVAGADHVAVWNGATWAKVGLASTFNDQVTGLASQGGLLYAWGYFTNAGDATGDYLAAWDGANWFGLNSAGASNGALTGLVRDAAVLSDGRVYAVGDFANTGPGGKCDHICWWDPASESWNPVGGSAAKDNVFNGDVMGLSMAGSKIYVGGFFTNAAGNAKADYIALWTGTTWTNLGSSGSGGALNAPVYDITPYAGTIIVTGDFTHAGARPRPTASPRGTDRAGSRSAIRRRWAASTARRWWTGCSTSPARTRRSRASPTPTTPARSACLRRRRPPDPSPQPAGTAR